MVGVAAVVPVLGIQLLRLLKKQVGIEILIISLSNVYTMIKNNLNIYFFISLQRLEALQGLLQAFKRPEAVRHLLVGCSGLLR
jgi:hypothetical protein